MKLRMGALVALVGVLTAFVLPMGTAQAQVTTPVTGSCVIERGAGTADDLTGTFTGQFEITRFIVRQGQLYARGLLTGTCTAIDPVTNLPVTETVSQVIRIPVDIGQTSGTCEILDLVLGPLHLDLLGLVIDLNQVELQITAEQGPGNLLGNLLCAVAGLLDRPVLAPNALAALLNQILNILG